jgi:hypothetical protein
MPCGTRRNGWLATWRSTPPSIIPIAEAAISRSASVRSGTRDAHLMAENIGKAGSCGGGWRPAGREAIRTIEVVVGNFGMVPSR